jgi:hypothetical protein
MKFGYTILSIDYNIGGLKNTIRSINNNYNDAEIVCVVNKDVSKDQFSEMKEVCNVYKGGNTITSLINKSFDKIKTDWNIFVIEGARICKNLEKRYSIWIKNENDIIFPLITEVNRDGQRKIYDSFHNCTLNGLCINKKFFKNVGNLSENPLEISRKFWAIDALSKNAKFKTILGIKIC